MSFGFVLLGGGMVANAFEAGGGEEVNPQATTEGYVDVGTDHEGYWIKGNRIDFARNELVSEYVNFMIDGEASVTNGKGEHVSGGWKEHDVYSKAYVEETVEGTNKCNYNYRY